MTSSENGYSLSLTTKKPSLSSPFSALLLLDSWLSPHNPAVPSLVPTNSDVGRGENVCCPGSAAKFRGDHESAKTRPCDKLDNRNEWVLSQHLRAHSQKTAQPCSPPSFFPFLPPFGPSPSPGLTHVALVANCVAGVAQPRKSTGWPLLLLLQPIQNII